MGKITVSAKDQPATDVIQLARQFATLDQRKKALKEELEHLEGQLADIEGGLLEAFASEGLRKIELDDMGIVVHVHKQMWARAAEDANEALCAALRRHDLGDLVKTTVNTMTLSSYVREQSRDGAELPEDIAATIVITDKFSVRTRKAAR